MMDDRDARALAQLLLANALPQRWVHVKAVAAEAAMLAGAASVDAGAVVCAAWLHDIGYADVLRDTGFHPLDGARYLRHHGWDDRVCRLVAHHNDASRAAERAGVAEQLNAEFTAVDGIELDILWTADVTTGPRGERMTVDERLAEIVGRHGSDSDIARSKLSSRPILLAAVARVEARIAVAKT